jgi:methionyl-tRNA formyltransferase
MPLRVVFMGTPAFSVPTLKGIIAAGHTVVAVFCQPPRPAGRGMEERRSPVHTFATEAGLAVSTPRALRNPEAAEAFRSHDADVGVVVAYGLILPKPILDAPRHGCLNLHASELPRWRGAAPIQRAVMAGDRTTAVEVMRMDEGLDTGPVCSAARMAIGPDMTAGELHDALSERGAALMVQALAALEAGDLTCTPQSEAGTTYAPKIDKSEARIVFSQPASVVHNLIRGLSPFPGAWFEMERGGRFERIKVLRSTLVPDVRGEAGVVVDGMLTVACGSGGGVRLVELQRAGKRPMSAAELLRGFDLGAGTRLG